jgi:hypothetical protein
MRRVFIALVLTAVALAACSDGKVTSAGYQGKPDIHPWDSPEAGGAKAQWERQIEERTLNQNEYTRTR